MKIVLYDKTYTNLTTLYLSNHKYLQLFLLEANTTRPNVSIHIFKSILSLSSRPVPGSQCLHFDKTCKILEHDAGLLEELTIDLKLWIKT